MLMQTNGMYKIISSCNLIRLIRSEEKFMVFNFPSTILFGKEHILEIDGVEDVHHIHIWSMDGINNYATMHIVTDADFHHIKEKVREELTEHGIKHATLELEKVGEHCHNIDCVVEEPSCSCHNHHHHH